jgi:hypothetical protein
MNAELRSLAWVGPKNRAIDVKDFVFGAMTGSCLSTHLFD